MKYKLLEDLNIEESYDLIDKDIRKKQWSTYLHSVKSYMKE